jgi:formiminotetrahydrofolate cyclodeaminase
LKPERDLLGLSVDELLDEIAGPSPLPGGGPVAALVAAMAAALVAMGARLSSDWEDTPGIAAQARSLRERLARLAHDDADVYAAVLGIRREPASGDPRARDWKLGEAYGRAADLPVAIADAAADVAELAAEVASRGDQAFRADVAGAALLAAAAARAAANLVAVNLAMTEDDERPARAAAYADAAAQAAQRALGTPG